MGNERWRDLGRRVVDRRVELGWRTREAFVEVSGLSRKTLGEIERGDRTSYDRATLATIEQKLRWPAGYVASVVGDRLDAQSLGVDTATGGWLLPSGSELASEFDDLIQLLNPDDPQLDPESREVLLGLLRSAVRVGYALKRHERESDDIDLPAQDDRGPDVESLRASESREALR